MESPVFGDIPTDTRLIETLAWQPGKGGVDADLHLDRMARSAQALGVPFDRVAAHALLASVTGELPLRCRLTLGPDGGFDLTTATLGPPAPIWTVALARHAVRSDDPWLRHKTTNRDLYDHSRATMPVGVDELLFLNQRGEVCEGTITNLFVRLGEGRQVTPPLSCGLLPGVLRGRLLASGSWSEQVLTPDDLADAEAIWVGNALRGLIRGRFQGAGRVNTA
ncbi:aminotransferase class IV family protein [Sedimentitalea todarodis]|uniref:Probable branched-chain-amino-acid aminotransferase n=1 Tax=Sedimentitalea todarodis TaxID=1631240 RepID=A0ABU3V7W3_9RHOB|nr:aminotransferase class IV family protein [Sedimentitalea todarodis]MDU9002266.1 aminotransferase class IV family protein [Sedimentitalea todarodis]